MTAADFVPGEVITDAAYLREWLAHEEAVYVGGDWWQCEEVTLGADALLHWYEVRRALRRVANPPAGATADAQEAGKSRRTGLDRGQG